EVASEGGGTEVQREPRGKSTAMRAVPRTCFHSPALARAGGHAQFPAGSEPAGLGEARLSFHSRRTVRARIIVQRAETWQGFLGKARNRSRAYATAIESIGTSRVRGPRP